MRDIPFRYRGKDYSGFVMVSDFKEPRFYWLIYNEPGLHDLVGEDSVCFQMIKGELVCTSLSLINSHPQLIETAKAIIEDHLAGKR